MPRMIAACFVLLLVSACAPALQQEESPLQPSSAVRVDVTNDHWSDVEVYLVRGQDRRRLGIVRGGASTHFFFPDRFLADGYDAVVRMQSTDKSGFWTSEPVNAAWGKTIGFRVAADVVASVRTW